MELLDLENSCPVKRRRGPKPLRVRAAFAATLWLDGQPLWQGGRVVWRHHDRCLEVGAGELDAASRALASLQRHEKTARRHCADFDSWHRSRLKQLETARYLASVRALDLEALVSPSRRRNPLALERLAQLLAVEACVEALPVSAAKALFEAWPLSQHVVQMVLHDESQPLAARALAALITGAARPLDALPGHPYLRRAARYGARFGFPVAPALCVALLEENVAGLENDVRCILDSLESDAPFHLDAVQLLALRREGKDASFIAAWVQAVEQLADPFPSIIFAPVAFKRFDVATERSLAQSWSRLKNDFTASLQEELAKMARHGRPGDLVHISALLAHFITAPVCALGALKVQRGRLSRREKGCPPFQSGIEGAISEVVQLLRTVSSAPEPGALLQLLREAAQEFGACQPVPALPPSLWAGQWQSYARAQQQKLAHVLYVAKIFGVEMAREVQRLNCSYHLISYHSIHRSHLNTELLNLALKMARCAPAAAGDIISGFSRWERYWKNVPGAHAALSPVIDALRDAEPAERAQWLTNIFDAIDWTRRGVCRDLPAIAIFLPTMRRIAKEGGEDFPRWVLVEAALGLLRSSDNIDDTCSQQRFEWLSSEIATRFFVTGDKAPDCGNIGDLVAILSQLAGTDETKFRQMMTSGWRYAGWDNDFIWRDVKRGIKLAEKYPAIESALVENFTRCPSRCFGLLNKLGPLDHFESARSPLEKLRCQDLVPLDVHWRSVNLDVSLEPWAIRFATAKGELGEPQDPPSSLLKIAAWPHKMAAEIAAIRQRGELPPKLAKRLDNLVSRLSNEAELRASMRQEMSETLQNATKEAELRAAERVVDRCYRIRLENLGAPKNVPLDDDLLNAALFSTDIESNRKWLREIVRAHCENRPEWRLEIAGNARWLRAMSERGLNQDQWLSEAPRKFRIGTQHIELRLESNPLQILQMGNYFDTCLSYGGCNSFSSVANAVELNKRVVYARDAKGRVVGRQLLALSTEGKLLGFRVYTSLDADESARLRHAFGIFARDFAASCGVERADSGEVERLFVADWYDDGTLNWSELEPVEPQADKNANCFPAPR